MICFWFFLLMCFKELFNIDNLICAKFEIAYPSICPSQNEWTKEPGSSNLKIHLPTGSDFCQFFCASRWRIFYVQKGFDRQDVFSALRI